MTDTKEYLVTLESLDGNVHQIRLYAKDDQEAVTKGTEAVNNKCTLKQLQRLK